MELFFNSSIIPLLFRITYTFLHILTFYASHEKIQFLDTAFLGIATGAVALCVTVLVDSIFWQR